MSSSHDSDVFSRPAYQRARRSSDDNEYLAIPVHSLRVDTITGFNLYLWMSHSHSYVLYRRGDLTFSDEHKSKLSDSGVAEVFIEEEARDAYLRYLEQNLGPVLADSGLDLPVASRIAYGCASHMMQELFELPLTEESMVRAHQMAQHTVDHIVRTPENLRYLIELMSTDYELYTHAVDVCILGIALGHRRGMNETGLHELGTGLLLHDVGKTEVDPSILRKEEPLTDEEAKLLGSHPARGALLAHERKLDAIGSLAVIRQHHEKCSGRGYPEGLSDREIHPMAKIAGLVNTFDGLTSNRPGRKAFLTYPAIRVMQEVMAEDYPNDLFREFVLMLSGHDSSRSRPAA